VSIDELARAAASDARRVAAFDLNAGEKLDQLRRTHRARRLGSIVAVIVAVALTASGIAIANRHGAHPVSQPAASPTASPAPTNPPPCSDRVVQCLGHDRFRVNLTEPVVLTLPDNFQGDFALLAPGTLEDYRNDVTSTGVTILENAVPVKYGRLWSRDPAAGTTAESMATWLSTRPFLSRTKLTPTTVGGRSAWRVTGTLKRDAHLPADKGGTAVAPTFTNGPVFEGYGRKLSGEYTLLDVPRAGVTVIWSWTLSHPTRELIDNLPYIAGLSFR
jgi:hypothetical protein